MPELPPPQPGQNLNLKVPGVPAQSPTTAQPKLKLPTNATPSPAVPAPVPALGVAPSPAPISTLAKPPVSPVPAPLAPGAQPVPVPPGPFTSPPHCRPPLRPQCRIVLLSQEWMYHLAMLPRKVQKVRVKSPRHLKLSLTLNHQNLVLFCSCSIFLFLGEQLP